MKAVILTNAPVGISDKLLLKNTGIFKLAINHHAEEFLPDERIISDYVLKQICYKFSEKVISIRDRSIGETDRVEYFDSEFKGATILSAIDYLIYKKYSEILIVGDNSAHNEKFKNLVKDEIDKIKDNIKIYQYSNGNFNLPVMTIAEFCAQD